MSSQALVFVVCVEGSKCFDSKELFWGCIVPVTLAVFVDTYNSFARVDFKTNFGQAKKYIGYNKNINGF